MKIELVDMPPLPVPSIVHAQRCAGHRDRPRHRPEISRQLARAPHVRAAGRVARQPARIRGDAGLRARRRRASWACPCPRSIPATASSRWPTREMGSAAPFRWQKVADLLAIAALGVLLRRSAAPPPHPASPTTSKRTPPGQLPGAPWKEETYKSGAVIRVDGQHAFSGKQALHVFTPRGAKYRRGYVAIHLAGPLPAAAVRHVRPRHGVAATPRPIALPGAPPGALDAAAGRGPFRRRPLQLHLPARRRERGRHAVHGQFRDHAAGDHRLQAAVEAHAAGAAAGPASNGISKSPRTKCSSGSMAAQVTQRGTDAPRANACRGNDLRRRVARAAASSTASTWASSGTRIPPTTRICGSTTWRLSQAARGMSRVETRRGSMKYSSRPRWRACSRWLRWRAGLRPGRRQPARARGHAAPPRPWPRPAAARGSRRHRCRAQERWSTARRSSASRRWCTSAAGRSTSAPSASPIARTTSRWRATPSCRSSP